VILGHGRVRAACWKKVTIEHDAIPNLNMDGMTMVFPPPTRTFEDQKGTTRPLHSRSHQR
jgi:hypothetical protein